jgi:hypothetical protein
MENLHFKIRSRWIKGMLSWIMKSYFFNNPSNLVLICCLTWLSSPESLKSFFVRIILQSNSIDLINWLVKNYLRKSIVRNKCKDTLLPVIICLSSIVYECDIHWWCCCIEYVAIWEIPVCTIFSIIPIIFLLNIWYCSYLFLGNLY